jgi:hypothetical protein
MWANRVHEKYWRKKLIDHKGESHVESKIQNKFETSKQRKIKKNDRGGEFKIYCKIFVNVTMYP